MEIKLIDNHHGIYIPKLFVEATREMKNWHYDQEDAKELSDPENGHYWEAWENVLREATYTDPGTGWLYVLHQTENGDLFAVEENCFAIEADYDFMVEATRVGNQVILSYHQQMIQPEADVINL
jgi:hypothetical protein